MISTHARYYRHRRIEFIENVIGIGREVERFHVDKGHPDGPEVHLLTNTGIIAIYNARTRKFVTALIARGNQIKRYYDAENRLAPEWLVRKAYAHERRGYNYM